MQEPERFDDAFRRWAARPVTSGAEAAAKLFTARNRRHGLRVSPAWATLAAAALVITSATAWVIGTRTPTPPVDSVGSRLAPSADSDIVVLWLDDQTPVHVFLTEASARGAK